MSRSTFTQALGAAAVTAYALFCLLVAVDLAGQDRRVVQGEDAVAEFLGAWERSLRGTYVVDAQYARRGSGGAELREATRVARRPPDSLTAGFGTTEAHRDGQLIRCNTDPRSSDLRCDATPAPTTHDERVEAELDALRSYVAGTDPAYRVVREPDGCFVLERLRYHPLATYGRLARFCFDPATGAPSLVRIEHDNGVVERTAAIDVRSVVTEDDLRPPG